MVSEPTKWKQNLALFRSKSEHEKTWQGDFTFIQGADTQFGLIDRYVLKLPTPNWDKEMALLEIAITKINQLRPKPKFFVVCGDMLDAYPTEGDGTEEILKTPLELRKEQLKDFNRIVEALDPEIPLVCVCGNHDIGEIPTLQTVQIYRDQFGDDFFEFWVGGVKFVVINSQYLKNSEQVPEEMEKQNQLLENLSDPHAVHTVMFQHVPFFIESLDEPDTYFNVPQSIRLTLLEKVRAAGVKYIFCGHYHGNVIGFYKDVEQIVTSAVGAQLRNDVSGFRIVSVSRDSIKHEYVPIEA